jgi:hypothetical protein
LGGSAARKRDLSGYHGDTEHNLVNTFEKEPLRPYALDSPPEHADGTINRTRQDALADERRRHG